MPTNTNHQPILADCPECHDLRMAFEPLETMGLDDLYECGGCGAVVTLADLEVAIS